ncbi:hypothetical protein [Dyadobacter alkalitolerans]|uniref:hypothetical protein n=1 Tax=Dyadobacter alkalitolerans TaxID=492736 RepID=UPI000479C9A9|nr:hypothetical protein [Dyadobacter alkalitolerans]
MQFCAYVYQNVPVQGGSAINMTVYGGTHDVRQTHRFYFRFYDKNNNEIENERVTVDMEP